MRNLMVLTFGVIVFIAFVIIGCENNNYTEDGLSSINEESLSQRLNPVEEIAKPYYTDTIVFKYIYDTIVVYDTLTLIDTVIVSDTVAPQLTGEWLKFSAYQAAINFVKTNYPLRANDRFSSMTTFCDYGVGTPAGRAGFQFVDEGNGIYTAKGYIFEYVFGAIGFVWGARENRPTEDTYWYRCKMKIDENNDWTLLEITSQRAGSFIRDTRHD